MTLAALGSLPRQALDSPTTGLLVSERLINCPPQLAPPLLQFLLEVGTAVTNTDTGPHADAYFGRQCFAVECRVHGLLLSHSDDFVVRCSASHNTRPVLCWPPSTQEIEGAATDEDYPKVGEATTSCGSDPTPRCVVCIRTVGQCIRHIYRRGVEC